MTVTKRHPTRIKVEMRASSEVQLLPKIVPLVAEVDATLKRVKQAKNQAMPSLKEIRQVSLDMDLVLIQRTLRSVPDTTVACPDMPDGFECSVALQGPWAFKLGKTHGGKHHGADTDTRRILRPTRSKAAAVSRCQWNKSGRNASHSSRTSCYRISSNITARVPANKRAKESALVVQDTMETVLEHLRVNLSIMPALAISVDAGEEPIEDKPLWVLNATALQVEIDTPGDPAGDSVSLHMLEDVLMLDINKAKVLDVLVKSSDDDPSITTTTMLYKSSERSDTDNSSATIIIVVAVVAGTLVIGAGITVLLWCLCLRFRKSNIFIRKIDGYGSKDRPRSKRRPRTIRIAPERPNPPIRKDDK